MMLVSERTAASIAPAKAARTDPAAGHHHDWGPYHYAWCNNDGTAIYNAAAIKPAVETGAAATSSICGAEACHRACNQSCSENVFHVFSLYWAAMRLPEHCYSPTHQTSEPSNYSRA